MLCKIEKALEAERIETWTVRKTSSERSELYFVCKKLDIPRLVRMTEYEVTVYHDFENGGKRFRGQSVCYVEEGQSEDEVRSKIRNAYYAAGFVKNPFYQLADPVSADHIACSSSLATKTVGEISSLFANAILSVESDGNAFVNSFEVFAVKRNVQIAGSNGLKVSFDDASVHGEFVTQCRKPVDVEQYRDFSYKDCDVQPLKDAVEAAIRDTRSRAMAKTAPSTGSYDILLTGKVLKDFFSYYAARGNASMIVPGYSTWKAGDQVQLQGEGELLNIRLQASSPYSHDGVPMKDLDYITGGKLNAVWGATRFMRYLGAKPTGSYDCFVLDNGSVPLSEMRGEGVLEAVSFSDFQMDIMSGSFGGEMRLSLLHKDGKDIPLAGGSMNAKIADVQANLFFSKERYKDSTYDGPAALLIRNIPVAGV